MGMIPMSEYARRLGKTTQNVGNMARRGKFKTAQKIGRDWYIDEDEEYTDKRETSNGKYRGWRTYGRKGLSNSKEE